ncbi:FKBP-type peptidyl-prolyl cis-trans isomerase [Candidatus Kapabacteria bacterium]|nr:FKBP-type peptidyl-prolyl cis-trans isomerase [Candidatus Kapabacteria bacterium]
MNLLKLITITLILNLTMMSQDMKTKKDSLSYALGMDIGKSLLSNPTYNNTINIDVLTQAINDSYKGNSKITQEEYQRIINAYQVELQQQQANVLQKQTDFLVENGKRKEVKSTSTGLQYEVMKEGTGAMPKATDKVLVHYHGTLIDGTVFDSSVERGQPIDFPLNGVIPGWTEGLQLMKEGGKYKFYIPSDLAYGDRGAGGKIQPGATLIFEVELLEIVK